MGSKPMYYPPAQGLLDPDEIRSAVALAGKHIFESDTWHPYHLPSHHFILIESGNIIVDSPSHRLEAAAGDLICMRPAEFNRYGNRGPTTFYQACITFAPHPHDLFTPKIDQCGALPVKLCVKESFASVRQAFETIIIELPFAESARQFRVKAAVMELLALIAGIVAAQPEHRQLLDEWDQLRARLDAGVHKDVCLEELASPMGIGVDYFIRQFRRKFGISPKAYHTRVRMQKALHLLRKTNRPIKSIAFDLGFSDPRIFDRIFKRHIGLSPSQIRDGQKEGNNGMYLSPLHLFQLNTFSIPAQANDPFRPFSLPAQARKKKTREPSKHYFKR